MAVPAPILRPRAATSQLPLRQRLIAWWPFAATIVAGLVITVLTFRTAQQAEYRETEAAWAVRADWRAQDLESKIEGAVAPAEAMAAAIASLDPGFSDGEFERNAVQAQDAASALRSLLWVPRVDGERRSDFEEDARRAGLTGFAVSERTPEGSRIPARSRDEHLPVRISSVFRGVPPELGIDLASDPIRRDAADRARDTGLPVATAIIREAESTNLQLFLPVYTGGGMPLSLAERRASLRGFVVGEFDAIALLNQAITNTPAIPESFTVRVIAASAPNAEPFAHFTSASRGVVPWNRTTSGSAENSTMRSFEALGQEWHVHFQFPDDDAVAIWSRSPYGWLLGGLLLTAMLGGFIAREKWLKAVALTLVEQRTAELVATASKMKALVDSSPLATIALDLDCHVVAWSRAAEVIFGYSSSEILGRPYPLIPAGGQEDFDRIFRQVAIDRQHVQDVRLQLRHQDGSPLDIVFSAAPLYDAEQQMIGPVYLLEDVTDKKRVEEKLVQAQKMEAVGQLTGGIAHDFNNILGLVVGNLDQLIEVCETQPEVNDLASAALDAALRGAELVRRLMAFSRNQPLAPKLLDLGKLVRGMEPVLRQTLDERLVIETRIAESVWPVLADQAQFENAILNLAINARDAMPDGGRLGINCANEVLDEVAGRMIDLPPGDYVTLTVSDTGTGIEPETLARVFEPFFTTKEVGKGSGLGLSMVYGYALQSGGSVKIYSEVGIGTEIRLLLPRALGSTMAEGPKLDPVLVATGSERILVVEDKPDVRHMAITLLNSLGYRTVAADNAAAAIGILDTGETFNLLFTDLIMPGAFGGIGLAREFRRRFPCLPIVFTTGFSDPAELQREMAALSASMIVKPYRKAELAICIRAALTQPVVA
jgi:PAS domain S-box-containing protein